MKILIFDNQDNLHSFEASEDWAVAFLLDQRLYSEPEEAHQYLIDCLEKPLNTGHTRQNIFGEAFCWPLSELDKFPGIHFVPNSFDYNICVVSLKIKKAIFVEGDPRFNFFDNALLTSGISKQDKCVDSFEGDLKIEFYKKIQQLLSIGFLDTDSEPVRQNHKQLFQKQLQIYIENNNKETVDFPADTPLFRYQINEKKTGWVVKIEQFLEKIETYENVVRLMFDTGFVLNKQQALAWQLYFEETNFTDERLNLDYLVIHKEKQAIEKEIISSSNPSSTDLSLPVKSNFKL